MRSGAVCLLVVALHPGIARADADALWQIVARCVDRTDRTTPYCACPAFARSCCGDTTTPDVDVVWGETSEFVAIRDMTMCGCDPAFTAGLAMPRTRITGIEDPARPDAIWPFAWRIARTRIADEQAIALVINPDDARTQNQMHVHILRLLPDARERLDETPGLVTVDVPDLQRVFTAGAERVGASAIGIHGMLVMRRLDGGYRIVLTDERSPQEFTRNRCATDGRHAAGDFGRSVNRTSFRCCASSRTGPHSMTNR